MGRLVTMEMKKVSSVERGGESGATAMIRLTLR